MSDVQDTAKTVKNDFFDTPTARAMGIRTLHRAKGLAEVSASSPNAFARPGEPVFDPGALLVLADNTLGCAVAGAEARHLVTLDMRVDWLTDIPSATELKMTARATDDNGRVAFAEGSVTGPDGAIVARAYGQFFVGASPGGISGSKPSEAILPDGGTDWPCFRDYIGLTDIGPNRYDLPPGYQCVGSPYLPAFHGGIIAAALYEAMARDAVSGLGAGAKALSVTTQFLTAAAAVEPLHIETSWTRQGRSVGVLTARSWQTNADRPTATAQAVFATNP